MNAWNSLKTCARMMAALCAVLICVLSLGGPRLQAQRIAAQENEYIYVQPPSRVGPDTKTESVTVTFAAYTVEPPSSDYPLVQWYLNGNFVAEQTATILQKTVNAGITYYEYWDPFFVGGGSVSVSPVPLPGRGRVLWQSTYSIPQGSPSGVYKAYIPSLNAYTNNCEILITPAQPPGGAKPALQIVKSATDQFKQPGSSISIFGDAKGHGLSLMKYPYGVAVDAEGFVYVADTENHTIRRSSPGGFVETVAGIDGQPFRTLDYDYTITTLTGGACTSTTSDVVTFDTTLGVQVGQYLSFSGGTVTPAWVGTPVRQVGSLLSDQRSVKLTAPLGYSGTGMVAAVKPDNRGARTQLAFEREPVWGKPAELQLAQAVTTAGSDLITVSGTQTLTVGTRLRGANLAAGTITTVVDFPFQTVVLSGTVTQSGTVDLYTGIAPSVSLPNSTTIQGSSVIAVASTLGLVPGMYVVGANLVNATTLSSFGKSSITMSGTANSSSAGALVSVATTAGSVALGNVALSGSSALVTSPVSPSGWGVGWFLEGVGIPSNTFIQSKKGGTLALSNTSTQTVAAGTLIQTALLDSSIPFLNTCGYVLGTNQIRVPSITGISPGMFVEASGNPFPPGTTVVSTTGTGTLNVSAVAAFTNLTASVNLYNKGPTATGVVTNGSNLVTIPDLPTQFTTLGANIRVYGAGIPSGTKLSWVTTNVELSNPVTTSAGTLVTGYSPVKSLPGSVLTTGSLKVVNVPDTVGLTTGMRVYAPGVANGTTITALETSLTLSNPATVTGIVDLSAVKAGPIITGAQLLAGVSQIMVSGTGQLSKDLAVIGTGIPPGSTITALPPSVRLSAPASVTTAEGGTLITASAGLITHQRGADPLTYRRYPAVGSSGTGVALRPGLTSEQIKAAGTEPLFDSPEGVATSDDLNVFVADTGNNAIRRIRFTSTPPYGETIVETFSLENLTYANVPGKPVTLTQPRGIVFSGSIVTPDPTNPPALYILDYNGVQKWELSATGNSVTRAIYIKNIEVGWLGTTPLARVYAPRGIAVTDAGFTVYVADTINHVIRRISLDPSLDPGLPTSLWSSEVVAGFIGAKGSVDGDTGYFPIRNFNQINFAGSALYFNDNPASLYTGTAQFKFAVLKDGVVCWTNDGMAAPGEPATAVSVPVVGGSFSFKVGDSSLTNMALIPASVFSNTTVSAGTSNLSLRVWIADQAGGYQLSANGLTGDLALPATGTVQPGTYQVANQVAGGTISFFGTTGMPVYQREVTQNVSRLAYPSGLALDANQNLYFTEMGSHKVRRVVFDSVSPEVSARVESLAGSGQPGPLDGSTGDGVGTGASFWYPATLAFDNSNPLSPSYVVADSANHVVRRIALSTTKVTSKGGSTKAGDKAITVSSTSGMASGMTVSVTGNTSATNYIPQGARIVSVNGATGLTLNTAALATGSNLTIEASKDSAVSSTMLGVPGVSGNRDFSEVTEYWPYANWLWYGRPIFEEWQFYGRVVADLYRLRIKDLKVEDSGPLEFSISNLYGTRAETNQSVLYVTPPSPDEIPKFWYPGYSSQVLQTSTGTKLGQLRLDRGDIDLSLSAFITPSDQVSYQWEVLSPVQLTNPVNLGGYQIKVDAAASVKAGDSLAGDGIADGTKVLKVQGSTLTISTAPTGALSNLRNWIPLKDSLTTTFQDSRINALVGYVGSSTSVDLSSISGAQTANLIIRRYQKTLNQTPPIPLPQVTFRTLSISKEGAKQVVTKDIHGNLQSPMTVNVGCAPVFSPTAQADTYNIVSSDGSAIVAGTAGEVIQIVLKDTAAGNSPDKAILTYPWRAGDDTDNPRVRPQYRWMRSSSNKQADMAAATPVTAAADLTSGVSPSATNFFNYTLTLPANFNISNPAHQSQYLGYYFVRVWNAESADYSDKSELTRLGGAGYYVDSKPIKIDVLRAPSLNASDLEINPSTPAIQFVDNSVNALTGSRGSFSLTVDVKDASATPVYVWQYLPWNALAAMPWAQTVDGAYNADALLNAGSIALAESQNLLTWSDIVSSQNAKTTGTAFGTLLRSDYISQASITFSEIPGDISGLYRLKATVPGNVKSNNAVTQYSKNFLVGVRGIPVDNGAYRMVVGGTTVFSTQSVDAVVSPYTVNLNDKPRIVLSGSVTTYSPDIRPLSSIYDYSVPLRYVWRRDGIPLSNGSNITINGGTLTIASMTDAELGTYTLQVSNAVSSTGVEVAPKLSSTTKGWSLLPKLDVPVILSDPTARTTNNGEPFYTKSASPAQRVAVGQSAILEVPVRSSKPLIYLWRKLGGTAPVIISEDKSRYTFSSTTGRLLIKSVVASDAGNYQFVIKLAESPDKDLLTRDMALFVEPVPDPATPVPSSTSFTFGNPVTLVAYRTSTKARFSASNFTQWFTYQWKKNGVPIAGETGESLSIAALARAHSGIYTVDVTGVGGTRTSPGLNVSVYANTVRTDAQYAVTFTNTSGVAYQTSPFVSGGSLAVGTKVSISGFAGSGKTLLGWQVFDSAGNITSIAARGGQFIMPASPVTISAVTGRPAAGSYAGFLSLQRPWGDSQWEQPSSVAASASKVRAFYKCTISSLGSLSGVVYLEGRPLAFASALSWTADKEWAASIQLRTFLADGTPWTIVGKAVINMGTSLFASTESNSQTVTLDSFNGVSSSWLLGKTVSGFGVPSGAVIQDADEVTKTITLSSPMRETAASVALVIGTDHAQTDNVLHVTLKGVVLEKTPPTVSSSQTLYGSITGSQGAYAALQLFIPQDDAALTVPATPRYTAAVYRYESGADVNCLGRGGVLSTSISSQGLAMVTGWLPNGSKLTYSTFVGRAFYRLAPGDPDPLGVARFSPWDADANGNVPDISSVVKDIGPAATKVMQEALRHASASVVLPIWSTTPPGDSAAEPLFGALLISGVKVDGCLGVLGRGLTDTSVSEYTHNYADGWLYDPTVVQPSTLAAPFSSTAISNLLTLAPQPDASSYQSALGPLAAGTLGLVFNSSASAVSSFTSSLDSLTGLFSVTFLENTSRYATNLTATQSSSLDYPDWAQKKAQLTVRAYGAVLQGARIEVLPNYFLPGPGTEYAPGIAGFLTRGTLPSGNYLRNVLGNQPQKAFTLGGTKTYRVEAISVIPYEPF